MAEVPPHRAGWGARLTASGQPLAPFRHPAFRAIWTANLFSNIGAMIQSVGAAWLMTELTRSHVLIALVQASATIPIMLLGLFAGAIADNECTFECEFMQVNNVCMYLGLHKYRSSTNTLKQ